MKKAKREPFAIPARGSAARAELAAKRREVWPYPIGTYVAFKRNAACVTSTLSISFFQAKNGKIAVYVGKSPTSPTRTMVEVSRLKVIGRA